MGNFASSTNQSTSASQNTSAAQNLGIQSSQDANRTTAQRPTTRQSTDASQAAQTNPEQYVNPVRRAVQGWRYTPLTITRWAADADGTSHPVDTEAKPFSLDYVFTFRCEHGHTSVTSGPQQAAR